MICDRYAVAVVPFPFAEVPVIKRRPVFVISDQAFNSANGHTIAGMITTAKRTAWPSDIPVTDLASAGLKVACIARLRLATVPNDLIIREIGKLGESDRSKLDAVLRQIIDI